MLSIESPCHPPTGALHAYLGGLCFNLASVTRDTRFARHRSSFACTTRRPSSREIARRGGEQARELSLPLSNKTCHLLVFT